MFDFSTNRYTRIFKATLLIHNDSLNCEPTFQNTVAKIPYPFLAFLKII